MLFVKSLTGKNLSFEKLDVNSTTVGRVHERIDDQWGEPPSSQKRLLLFEGTVLVDHTKTLHEYNVHDGAVLRCVLSNNADDALTIIAVHVGPGTQHTISVSSSTTIDSLKESICTRLDWNIPSPSIRFLRCNSQKEYEEVCDAQSTLVLGSGIFHNNKDSLKVYALKKASV